MRCYQHRGSEAVAVCKHCGKGTCAECQDNTAHGIACSGACEAALWDAERLRQRQLQYYGLGIKPPWPASVSTYFFFGLILALVALYLTITRPGIDFLTFAMAAVFFVMSAAAYKRYRDGCDRCN